MDISNIKHDGEFDPSWRPRSKRISPKKGKHYVNLHVGSLSFTTMEAFLPLSTGSLICTEVVKLEIDQRYKLIQMERVKLFMDDRKTYLIITGGVGDFGGLLLYTPSNKGNGENRIHLVKLQKEKQWKIFYDTSNEMVAEYYR